MLRAYIITFYVIKLEKPLHEITPTTLATPPTVNFGLFVAYVQFPIQVCFSGTAAILACTALSPVFPVLLSDTFSRQRNYDLELRPVTLIY